MSQTKTRFCTLDARLKDFCNAPALFMPLLQQIQVHDHDGGIYAR